MWQKIEADGCEWEVRSVAEETGSEVLEFRPLDPTRPARRFGLDGGTLQEMDEEALHAAFRQARPIGGDFYGRPGKRMTDVRG